jgi:hypothetical protein
MGKADSDSTTPLRLPWAAPALSEIHSAAAALSIGSDFHAEAERWGTRFIRLDPPMPAALWLQRKADQLKTAPDCPARITDAARWLAPKMEEAFQKRECDAVWTVRSIENALRDWGLWLPARPTSR